MNIRVLVALCIAAGMWSRYSSAQPVQIEVPFPWGTPAPGMDGVVFDQTSGGMLGSDGRFAFSSVLLGPGVSNKNRGATWLVDGGPPTLFIRGNDLAPGFDWPNHIYGGVIFQLNDHGAFVEMRSRAGEGYWLYDGRYIPLLHEHHELVGHQGSEVDPIDEVRAAGKYLAASFEARLPIDGRNRKTIALITDGNAQVASRLYGEIPGEPGSTFSEIGMRDFSVNDSGQLLFRASDHTNANALFLFQDGVAERLVSSLDPAPGLDPRAEFGRFYEPRLNSAGDVAFAAKIGGINLSCDEGYGGIWLWRDGKMRIVAGFGQHVSDGSHEYMFRGFGPPALSSNGDVAFMAYVSTPGSCERTQSIWVLRPRGLEMIAIKGQQPPGEQALGQHAGTLFGCVYPPINCKTFSFQDIMVDERGFVIFLAFVVDEPGAVDSRAGWWVYTPSGRLVKIFSQGDLIESGGVTRTIWDVSPGSRGNGEDGQLQWFRDGVFLMKLRQDDNTVELLSIKINEPCAADFAGTTTAGAMGNPDGLVTGADLQYYVNLWLGKSRSADLIGTDGAGHDGSVTAADLQYFVNHWIAGCP